MVDVAYDSNDRWNIPDDRQLALRGRLQTGWSSYQQDVFSVAKKHSLNEDEQFILREVLEKKEKIQLQEQARIGGLVKKLEDMRSKVLGDGATTCLICGTKAGLLKDQLRYCFKCSKMVCPKCSIDPKVSTEIATKAYFCVLCYEERQLWKRSGAWFFNSMPKYTLPESDEYRYGTLNRHAGSLYGGRRSSKGSSILSLHQHHNESDSIDEEEASDSSDSEDHRHVKTFDSRNRSNWMDEEDSIGITSMTSARRNAVAAKNSGDHKVKKQASKTSSSDSDEHSSAMSPQHQHNNRHSNNATTLSGDRKFTSQLSIPSSENSITMEERRGSMTSLSSTEGGNSNKSNNNNKNKLGIHQRVLRKLSRDDDSSGKRSPRSLRKTSNQSDSSSLRSLPGATATERKDCGASTEGSEQDIDAMFKDYEKEQAAKTPEQKEYTGKVGMIEFTLQYDPNTQELLVIVHSCKGLKGDKGKSPTLPYVKTYILPEAQKATKKRTSSMKKTENPVYNETLVYFGVSGTDIENKGLKLSVMDETKVGNNAVIGETSIPLKTLSTRPVQQFRRILDLKSNDSALFLDTKKTLSNPGRIELALHYLSKQGKLVVGVIRCSGLKAMDPNGYSDPYVKCYLLPDPSKKTKQKTQVKKKTLNPEFNEEFSYKIPHSELAKRTLHISVWDYDMGRTNDFIGGITLGIEASGDLLRHWFETLQTQDRRVIKWHTLSETCPIINE